MSARRPSGVPLLRLSCRHNRLSMIWLRNAVAEIGIRIVPQRNPAPPHRLRRIPDDAVSSKLRNREPDPRYAPLRTEYSTGRIYRKATSFADHANYSEVAIEEFSLPAAPNIRCGYCRPTNTMRSYRLSPPQWPSAIRPDPPACRNEKQPPDKTTSTDSRQTSSDLQTERTGNGTAHHILPTKQSRRNDRPLSGPTRHRVEMKSNRLTKQLRQIAGRPHPISRQSGPATAPPTIYYLKEKTAAMAVRSPAQPATVSK